MVVVGSGVFVDVIEIKGLLALTAMFSGMIMIVLAAFVVVLVGAIFMVHAVTLSIKSVFASAAAIWAAIFRQCSAIFYVSLQQISLCYQA